MADVNVDPASIHDKLDEHKEHLEWLDEGEMILIDPGGEVLDRSGESTLEPMISGKTRDTRLTKSYVKVLTTFLHQIFDLTHYNYFICEGK